MYGNLYLMVLKGMHFNFNFFCRHFGVPDSALVKSAPRSLDRFETAALTIQDAKCVAHSRYHLHLPRQDRTHVDQNQLDDPLPHRIKYVDGKGSSNWLWST